MTFLFTLTSNRFIRMDNILVINILQIALTKEAFQ